MKSTQGIHEVHDTAREGFIRQLLEKASGLRVPTIAGQDKPSLYRVENRHGVTVVALRTASLSQQELVAVMTYRLAQYVTVSFVDPKIVLDACMEHEPLSNSSQDEVHIIAVSAKDSEILCYACFKGSVNAPLGTKMADPSRPLFPVETICGAGVYNRLTVLPDLPVARVRELGRLMKNQCKDPLDELVFRATMEVTFAIFQLAIGPLRTEMDAVIGHFEEGVAMKNLEFFHVPFVCIRGVVPFLPENGYTRAHLESRSIYPFAVLIADLSHAINRLAAIESALNFPGRQGIAALLGLKADLARERSSLEPPGGFPALTNREVPQQGLAMDIRRQLLDNGTWLRTTTLLSGLSVAEAAVLGTFMERRVAIPGDRIIREGEIGDELYLIESGEAEVIIGTRTGRPVMVAKLGSGEYFGEISLITGGERTADVVASTEMTLMRLTKQDYLRYLQHLTGVHGQLTRAANDRVENSPRKNQAP